MARTTTWSAVIIQPLTLTLSQREKKLRNYLTAYGFLHWQRIIQAATIVGAAFVASRLLGVVRDATINYFYDIDSLEANAYFIASRFPELIFLVIAGGAIGSAFIPVFSEYL